MRKTHTANSNHHYRGSQQHEIESTFLEIPSSSSTSTSSPISINLNDGIEGNNNVHFRHHSAMLQPEPLQWQFPCVGPYLDQHHYIYDNGLQHHQQQQQQQQQPPLEFAYSQRDPSGLFDVCTGVASVLGPGLELAAATHHNSLIDNLAGNWAPNSTGTYTPFGPFQAPPPVPAVVRPMTPPPPQPPQEPPTDHRLISSLEENEMMVLLPPPTPQPQQQQQQHQSQHAPTIITSTTVELKPTKPTYSDVLTKCVYPNRGLALDVVCRDGKMKKGGGGGGNTKNSKHPKSSGAEKTHKKNHVIVNNTSCSNSRVVINSSNNCDYREMPTDCKTSYGRATDKSTATSNSSSGGGGGGGSGGGAGIEAVNLPRKWTSLENITQEQETSGKLGGIDENTNGQNNKRKKLEENTQKMNAKLTKQPNQLADENDAVNTKKNSNSQSAANKLINKKSFKNGIKQKNADTVEKTPTRRGYRIAKKRDNRRFSDIIRQHVKFYVKKWLTLFFIFISWLFHLISDICIISMHIIRDVTLTVKGWCSTHYVSLTYNSLAFAKKIPIFRSLWKRLRIGDAAGGDDGATTSKLNSGASTAKNNINMPTTGEEAMKRLLACKGKDPYSILGVTPSCSDDDIKRYYKRQAVLVHPDKNQQPGAEEAFKILVRAFDMIGEPEHRADYDKGVMESAQADYAYTELTELLAQLQKKMESAVNTIRCSACGSRHKRTRVERPCYAARNCAQCKIHHAAREGDIWAEARCWGFRWNYYAFMDGSVYDITEWAACQRKNLQHLKPDVHQIQYRITLGKQSNNGNSNSSSNNASGGSGGQQQQQRNAPNSAPPTRSEPATSDLEHLLNTLYGQGETLISSTKRRNKKPK